MIKKGLMKTLAEVGKIKTGYKGEMKKTTNGVEFQPPKKLDYFIITTTERDKETGNLIENKAVMEKLGEKPRELKIRLPFDSIDKNFFTQYQAYNGGKKICSGDGETAERRGDVSVSGGKLVVKGEDKKTIPCDFETCPIALAGKCKVSGILSAFLPQTGDLGGVYKFRTHSWNGVSSILAALEFFSEQTHGILMGLPLKLVLLKKTTEEHGTICYATVVLDGEELSGLRRAAIAEMQDRKLLGVDIAKVEAAAEAQGFFEDHDDPEEVTAEFYSYETDEKPEPKIKGTSGESLASLVKKAAGDVETVEAETVTPAPEKKSEHVAEKPAPKAEKPEPAKQAAPVKDEIDLF